MDLADPRLDSRSIPLELRAHRSLRQGEPRNQSFSLKRKIRKSTDLSFKTDQSWGKSFFSVKDLFLSLLLSTRTLIISFLSHDCKRVFSFPPLSLNRVNRCLFAISDLFSKNFSKHFGKISVFILAFLKSIFSVSKSIFVKG